MSLAALAFVAWLLLAFGHLHDRYNVNAVSGSLLALAERAREGVLYPPLFDGQSYGGTRVMPLPILLYAGAISLGGDLLAPAKLVDFTASLALVGVFMAVLARLGAPVLLSLALVSTVITTQVFLIGATGIRPEALPTTLQLGAVALVAFSPRRRSIVAAAVLCAIAVLCKISAVWAPVAIALWLLARNRGWLVAFVCVFAAVAAGLLLAAYVASDGRIVTNLVELGGAGLSVAGVIKAPLKTIELVSQYAQSTLLLLPVILLGLLFATRHARPTLFEAGLVIATGITLFVMADVGSDYNHLLDLVVLVPIVAYGVSTRLVRRLANEPLPWSFLIAGVLVGSSTALAINAGSGVAGTLGLPGATIQGANNPRPLAAELDSLQRVLPEDPYISLYRGERPPVMDAFMLLRIARKDPQLVGPLEQAIVDGQFQAIVLGENLQLPETESWFRDFAFGPAIYRAIKDHYQLCAAAEGQFMYGPAGQPCPTAAE